MNIHTLHLPNPDTIRLFISELSRKVSHLKKFKPVVIILWILDTILRRDKGIIQAVNGVTYELNTKDLIDFRLLYFGSHDTEIVNYLKSQIGLNDAVLWDIGANVGSISLPLSIQCPKLKIFSFEPSPAVFKRLETNVSLNPHCQIAIYQTALSNISGVIDFFVSSEPNNSGVGNLAKTSNSNSIPIPVQCSSGDSLIEQDIASEPNFIKVDVEGFEYEVFSGMKSFLERAKNVQIIFEHEPYRMYHRQLPLNTVTDFFVQLGFKLYVLSEDGMSNFDSTLLTSHCNIVALCD